MRFNRDGRKCVVFLGYPDHTKGANGIRCEGTGFLIQYENGFYLVTARHVAHVLGETGCVARINKKDGSSGNVDGDFVRWFYHPDENVDVAVTPFGIGPEWGFDFLYLDGGKLLLTKERETVDHVELGDMCYTVGLFRVLVGNQRNLPVIHTGNLARLAGEEPIPIRDDHAPGGRRLVDGYLVETQSLSGLSGAPVFIRQSLRVTLYAHPEAKPHVPEHLDLLAYKDEVLLLGMWQAAWEAPAGEVLTLDRGGKEMTVPVGMGVVVPATKIVEVLELPDLKKMRHDAAKKQVETQAAQPQSISNVSAPTAENPNHRSR
jgi:hypothetical protein